MPHRDPSLTRRIAPAVVLTGVGFVIVNALDRPVPVSGAPAAGDTTVDPSAPVSVAGGQALSTTVPPVTSPVQAQGQSAPPATQSPVATTPKTTTAPKATSAPAPAPTVAPAPSECGAIAKSGAEAAITWNRSYGVISVSAKFTADGTLCDASAQWTTYDSRSQRYEDYAVPILNKQAEAAHGADIQGVSGATAVSEAYRQSLQSALDQL